MQVHMTYETFNYEGFTSEGWVCILTRMAHINLLVLHAIDINSHNTRQRIKRKIQDNIK
jgi:hypothetical protein